MKATIAKSRPVAHNLQAGIWVLILNLGANIYGVEEVGGHVFLGSIGVLLGFLLTTANFGWVFHGDIVFHFPFVTDFVGRSLILVLLHLFL